MRFEAVELIDSEFYAFIIETRDKPDNALRERIREQIREAMESLGFSPGSYSVTVLKADSLEEAEDRGYPKLRREKNIPYLVF